MSKTLQITLPDKTYKSLEALCNQEKIRPSTMVVVIIRKALENDSK
ncbi:MAG: hypothetical protein IMF11_17405 [Proteobacteria bacterium]|nr:hypothetical protein [Pseudomonadota bacterium]